MKTFKKRCITPDQIDEICHSQNPAAFDGAWIGACSSTHIYCRVVCPAAGHVDLVHVRAFPSCAAAEDAGYRPCLTCCPEFAPAPSKEAGFSEEAVAFAAYVADHLDNANSNQLIVQAAAAANLSMADLPLMLDADFGTSPESYVACARRLAAKKIMRLQVVGLPEVAAACGFSSAEALAEQFRSCYGLNAEKLASQRPRKPCVKHLR